MSIKTSKDCMFAMAACIILIGLVMLVGCKTDRPGLIISRSDHAIPAAPGKIPFPRPESHEAGWLKYHGDFSGVDWNKPGRPGSACLTCHEKSDCIQCHNVSPPGDHNNTWRTLSHGFAASGDRERCLNCHRQDYCIRCHNETAPRSHKGNWEANHCSSCHFVLDSAFGNGCAVCHKKALHLSAPHTINPKVDCLECHS